MDNAPRKLHTPEAILSYPNLLKPRAGNKDGTGKLKYSAVLVFTPGSDRRAMEAGIVSAASEKFGDKIKVGKSTYTAAEALANGHLASPWRDKWEEKGYPEGSVFFSAKSDTQPGMVHPYIDPATGKVKKFSDDEIVGLMYPGAIVIASVTFYGFDNSGNKGVAVALNGLQWVKDGPRYDSRVAAEDDFGALASTPADISWYV